MDKWIGTDYEFKAAEKILGDAVDKYESEITKFNRDTSRTQARKEFFRRAAEHYGFQIYFNDEPRAMKECP